jgi:protein-ribulosamine 3-kinase
MKPTRPEDILATLAQQDGMHRRAHAGRRVLVKIKGAAPATFFEAEAVGLRTLAASSTVRVPAVFAVARHGIVLEDLGHGHPSAADWLHAGRALARMHRVGSTCFGLPTSGWCGDSWQDNSEDADGFRFHAERRLLPQAVRAHDDGLLSAQDLRRVEALCARLPTLLPAAPPVLLHGDLWSGNLHPCADGELALIDAGAVHFGWAEADLAMLILFGEPASGFLAAYHAESGSDGSWRQRAPLLNLYHLLNHLNLFGRGYLGVVRRVLDEFT